MSSSRRSARSWKLRLPESAAHSKRPCPALCEVLELPDEGGHVARPRRAHQDVHVIRHHAKREDTHEVERRALSEHVDGGLCHGRFGEHPRAITSHGRDGEDGALVRVRGAGETSAKTGGVHFADQRTTRAEPRSAVDVSRSNPRVCLAFRAFHRAAGGKAPAAAGGQAASLQIRGRRSLAAPAIRTASALARESFSGRRRPPESKRIKELKWGVTRKGWSAGREVMMMMTS